MSAHNHTILLTGARSLVGMHVAIQAGDRAHVRRMSRRSSFDAEVVGDLRNDADRARAVAECDTVIHVALRGPTSGGRRGQGLREVQDAEATRGLLRAAQQAHVRRVVLGVPTVPLADGRRGFSSAVDAARAEGLDVRILRYPTPVGAYDVGPSWVGRAMLRFAAGGVRTFVAGSLALAPAADVASALFTLAHDDTLPAHSNWSLAGDAFDVREVLELWADGFGPRSRPWQRPGVLRPPRRRGTSSWMRRLLREDFDPRDAGPNPSPTEHPAAPLVQRPTSVPDAVDQAITWFTNEGLVRLAREQTLAS